MSVKITLKQEKPIITIKNNGSPGLNGSAGLSAYEIALNNGFSGTETEYLLSLKGQDGINGTDGKSAYELALLNGFIGTEQEYLLSLKGQDGINGTDVKSAYELAVLNGFIGTEQEWLDSLKGEKGDSATITIGTTTTLEPGQNASVINSGTLNDSILNFSIPKGIDGESAYQQWLSLGNTGSETDFINSLKATNNYNELINKPDLSNFLISSNIKAGSNITLNQSGNDITINASGGSGGSSNTNIDINNNQTFTQNIVLGTNSNSNTIIVNSTTSKQLDYTQDNTIIGFNSLNTNQFYGNTLIGNRIGNFGNLFGCTAIGNDTLKNNSFNIRETSGCVAIGSGALNYTTGDNNTAIGSYALNYNLYSNCSGLGYGVSVSGNNQVQLGNSDTTTYVYGTVQNRSDFRDKAEIRDTILGLDFINSLRPVDYKWDMRDDYKQIIKNEDGTITIKELPKDGSKIRKRYHHGFIAQDFSNKNFGGYQNHSISGGGDIQTLGYDEFIAPLVKSVQELTLMIKELQKDNLDLKQQILYLQKK